MVCEEGDKYCRICLPGETYRGVILDNFEGHQQVGTNSGYVFEGSVSEIVGVIFPSNGAEIMRKNVD